MGAGWENCVETLKCVTIKPEPANNPANKVSLKFNSAAAPRCLFNDTVIESGVETPPVRFPSRACRGVQMCSGCLLTGQLK